MSRASTVFFARAMAAAWSNSDSFGSCSGGTMFPSALGDRFADTRPMLRDCGPNPKPIRKGWRELPLISNQGETLKGCRLYDVSALVSVSGVLRMESDDSTAK